MNKKITLGSGKLYCLLFDPATGIPEDDKLETDDNLLGLIQGGATLTYESEFYTAQDDFSIAVKRMLTSETITLKAGICTWNGSTLKKLCSTARVSEDADNKTRTVKIGGAGNFDGKKYIIRFVHSDPQEGDIRVSLIGTNEAGFEMAFAKDQETVLEPEFTALGGMDEDGTLVEYREDM